MRGAIAGNSRQSDGCSVRCRFLHAGYANLNVALGGTLKLDIGGHNLPEQKDHDIRCCARIAARSIGLSVNGSHHQAIDRLAAGCDVEGWCATDDIIEQIRLRDYPFSLACNIIGARQIYDELFDDFSISSDEAMK
jgi:putative glutamine amidotransferase